MSDFLLHQRFVYFSDLIRIIICNNTAFRMTGISLDVVGQNIVIYASTGITLSFSRFNYIFPVFLRIFQSRFLFFSFSVKSVRQQSRW